MASLFDLDDKLWIIILQEALIYLLVLGQWMLPREGTNRTELSEVLVHSLTTALDIMQLFALFDEHVVLVNPVITYAILAVWSISFLRFIIVSDVLEKDTGNERKEQSTCVPLFKQLMGIFFQDGTFLCSRLFIMIRLRIITQSLVFFLLKNALSALIQAYKIFQIVRNKSKVSSDKYSLEGESKHENIAFDDRSRTHRIARLSNPQLPQKPHRRAFYGQRCRS